MINTEPTYEELLEDRRWKILRRRVLSRDNHRCQLCGETDNLNVHHRYYLLFHAPWAYCEHALITLCQSCHKMIHDILPPLVYAQDGNILKRMKFTPCVRCNGYGFFSEYKHIQGGVCFRCKGLRYEELVIHKPSDTFTNYIDKRADIYDSVVPLNIVEAEAEYKKAMSLYEENPEEARKLLLLSAKSGNRDAQNEYGLMLKFDDNLQSAKRWFLYSAMQGQIEAKKHLLELLDPLENSAERLADIVDFDERTNDWVEYCDSCSNTQKYIDVPAPVEEFWMSVDEFYESHQMLEKNRRFLIKTFVNNGIPFRALGLRNNNDENHFSYFVLSKKLLEKGYTLDKAFLKENKNRIRVLTPSGMLYSELGLESDYGWIYLADT